MVITYVSWITLEFFNVTFFFNQVAFPHFMDAVFICVIFYVCVMFLDFWPFFTRLKTACSF